MTSMHALDACLGAFEHNTRMAGVRIPLVILGGSDRRPTTLPPAGADKHPLSGYKGVDIRIGGRPLIGLLVERLRTCPELDPIRIAGPAAVYAGAGIDVPVIDTDARLGENIRAAVESVRRDVPGSPIAVTTCDILPDPSELRALLDDWRARPASPLWFPLVRSPRDREALRSFGWKPRYRIVLEPGRPATIVLPGHLMIFDPDALRMEFIYDLMQVAYATRNRSVVRRALGMTRRLLPELLLEDLQSLLRLRLPTRTLSVLRHGLGVARKVRAGTLLQSELERAVTVIIARPELRRAHPERGVQLPILEGLTLAEDVDTVEEARELERAVRAAGAEDSSRPLSERRPRSGRADAPGRR